MVALPAPAFPTEDARRPPSPPTPGALLADDYEVVAHLRRGRDLDVYDVWSRERYCRCVAKAVRPDLARPERGARLLRREWRILRALTHPHIVRAYELIEPPRAAAPCLILQALAGETLGYMVDRHRRRGRRIATRDIAMLGGHLCAALAYLHGRGYLHLDLKPSNVVVEDGIARLIDLSIARRPGRGRRGMGTRQYMAPEQARGHFLTEATDVWGLGATLFELATGRTPFRALPDGFDQLQRTADRVRRERRVPAALDELIANCLDPDPVSRPHLRDVWHALDVLSD